MRIKIGVFTILLFVTALVNAVFIFFLEKQSEKKLQWVNHTHSVMIKTENLLSSLQDMETGQRGFLLTKNPAYLEPFHTGVTNSNASFKLLQQFTLDNPAQQKRLNVVKNLIRLKHNELNETIKFMQVNDKKRAIEIVKKNTGKEYMDKIRSILGDFITDEKVLLEKRKGDLREVRGQITTLIIAEIIFFIFLAIITFLFLQKNLFEPLKLLLDSTRKMDSGEEVDIIDVIPKDEMGFLLATFFKMQRNVYKRTESLDFQANHDELTGLRNRAHVFEDVSESIESAIQNNSKCAILFLDLNKFKPLNDELGHDAGDLVLKETAKRIEASVRSEDIVYRIGGDEFIVLVNIFDEISNVEVIISKIISTVEMPISIQGKPVAISTSIGVAVSPDNSIAAEELIKMADVAMYQSKSSNNQNYSFFEKSMLKRKTD